MVTKAVIPVAGLGTRLRPITCACPKALLPLVDSAGRARSVFHHVLTEAAAAGAAEAAVVISPGQRELIERYLAGVPAGDPLPLPAHIRYLVQPEPAGFGDAVLRAAGFVGENDFLVLLGDHVHLAEPGRGACAAQVAEAFAAHTAEAMVGMQPVAAAELPRVGVGRGEPLRGNVYRCTAIVEKPTEAQARAELVTPGLPEGTYLAHCGIYAFSPRIFACLSELRSRVEAGGELQLTDAQQMLLAERPEGCYLVRIAGSAHDTGTPEGYAATFAAVRAGQGRAPGD